MSSLIILIELATNLPECSERLKPHPVVQSDRGGIRHCHAGYSRVNVFYREKREELTIQAASETPAYGVH